METFHLPVRGMTCEHCERTVEAALTRAGASDAHADHRRSLATFRLAGDTAAVIEAVRADGYQPGRPSRLAAAGPDGSRQGSGGGNDFDLVTIGSGSAAFAAAIRATNIGARVAMVEAGTVGGTCVNVGCIPSKALLAAADTYQAAGAGRFPGVATAQAGVDMATLVAGKDDIVSALRQEKYLDLATEYGFEIITGPAAFTGADRLAVDGREIPASRFLVATGSAPFIPPIPGLAEVGYLTSTTAMGLDRLPESLIVIGGNYIGLEMGQLFADLGVKVTIVEALDRLAPNEEPEVSAWITEALQEQGVEVVTSATVTAVEPGEPTTVIGERAGKQLQLTGEKILVAAGRRPVLEALGLEAAGVALDQHGRLVLDDRLATTNPNVYAAGDVTGAPQFVYVAAAQGTLAADNAIGGSDRTMDYTALPRVTFTTPAIAAVGLTDAQAQVAGYDCDCRVLELGHVPRARANRDSRGGIKLVAERHTGRVLGLSAVADGAGDLILAGVYAVKFGLTVSDLADTWAPYLTMAESVKLAAQTFTADVSKLSCCAA